MKRGAKPTDARAAEAQEYQNRVPYLLGAISNILSHSGSRFYRSVFGLGLTEGRLMYVLGSETVLTARQASQIMGIDKGATSRALAGLQRRGLVQLTVDGADTRQRVIQFTKAGEEVYARILSAAQERERQLLSIFAEEEKRLLSTLLQRLHAHVSSAQFVDAVRSREPAQQSRKRGNQRPARPRRKDA